MSSEVILEAIYAYVPQVAAALAIVVVGSIVARVAAATVRRAMQRSGLDSTLVSFAANLLYMVAIVLVGISALGQLGVNTTSFAAVLGAAGLAIGFALQGSLANFAAGAMLIFFRPFRAGDYVEAGGVAGTVEEIQVFSTVLKTPDNRRIVVPNAQMTGGPITNYSANPTRRIDLVFGIGYGDDPAVAKQLIARILGEDSRILKEPAPVVAVLELADSSVNLAVRPWVATADYWDVRFALTERIKVELDAHGISIPFPQRDVHLHQVA